MGKRKAELKIKGMDELIAKFEKMSKGALEPAMTEGLKDVQNYLNERLDKTLVNAKLPAQGKYSTGDTKKSIVRDQVVTKENDSISIKLGFNLKESGLTSIYLMYGTPRMAPAKGLHAVFNGAKSRREAKEIFEQRVQKEIKKIMNS
ncbi:MAG: hypothetical protein H9W82_12500 [Lactobacillus sp.]|nr:hypothetical protein [Lactobacillus sp.]